MKKMKIKRKYKELLLLILKYMIERKSQNLFTSNV